MDKIAVCAIREDGTILKRVECPTEPEKGFQHAMQRIIAMLRDMSARKRAVCLLRKCSIPHILWQQDRPNANSTWKGYTTHHSRKRPRIFAELPRQAVEVGRRMERDQHRVHRDPPRCRWLGARLTPQQGIAPLLVSCCCRAACPSCTVDSA